MACDGDGLKFFPQPRAKQFRLPNDSGAKGSGHGHHTSKLAPLQLV